MIIVESQWYPPLRLLFSFPTRRYLPTERCSLSTLPASLDDNVLDLADAFYTMQDISYMCVRTEATNHQYRVFENEVV